MSEVYLDLLGGTVKGHHKQNITDKIRKDHYFTVIMVFYKGKKEKCYYESKEKIYVAVGSNIVYYMGYAIACIGITAVHFIGQAG